jgi:hypothetical protein
MRRAVFTTIASIVVLALAPASALASHHHKRHHGRAHHARVHHARVRRFGDVNSSSTTTPPSTTTATPTAVGTVDSFTNGVLTIKLNDGSTVSGAVTNDTEIECQMAQSTGTVHQDGDGGDQGGGDNQGGNGGGDENGGGDDQGEQNQNCTSADLTTGAMVGGAELQFSSPGATWEKVELIG